MDDRTEWGNTRYTYSAACDDVVRKLLRQGVLQSRIWSHIHENWASLRDPKTPRSSDRTNPDGPTYNGIKTHYLNLNWVKDLIAASKEPQDLSRTEIPQTGPQLPQTWDPHRHSELAKYAPASTAATNTRPKQGLLKRSYDEAVGESPSAVSTTDDFLMQPRSYTCLPSTVGRGGTNGPEPDTSFEHHAAPKRLARDSTHRQFTYNCIDTADTIPSSMSPAQNFVPYEVASGGLYHDGVGVFTHDSGYASCAADSGEWYQKTTATDNPHYSPVVDWSQILDQIEYHGTVDPRSADWFEILDKSGIIGPQWENENNDQNTSEVASLSLHLNGDADFAHELGHDTFAMDSGEWGQNTTASDESNDPQLEDWFEFRDETE